MKKILFIIFISGYAISQPAFQGLNAWTQSSTIGLAGGGYLLWGQNDFRNAGMLYNSKRKMKFTIVKYPAGINGQSIVGNGTINSHNLGFKINRINYGIFDGRDIENQKTENYSASDLHLQMGYAKASNSGRVIIGINGGILLSKLEKSNASAITLSPAIIYNSGRTDFGFSLQNYGKVINNYGESKESMPVMLVTSISRQITPLPLILEFDHQYSKHNKISFATISGILIFKNGLIIKGGKSYRMKQMTNISFIRNFISDFGIGLEFDIDDIIIDINTYNYSAGGFIIAMGISVLY